MSIEDRKGKPHILFDGPSSAPELAQKYPLILTAGTRIQSTFRSQHLNIPGLLKL